MKKYIRVFQVGFQNALEYRADFMIGLCSLFFPLFIQINMWIQIFSNSKKDYIYNYNLMQMICYVVLSGLISKAMNISVEYEIMSDIKDGGLSKFLTRPISYLGYRISQNIGGKCAQMIIVFVFIVITMIISAALFTMNYTFHMVLVFLFAIILSIILKVAISILISSLAFWIGETWAAFMMLDVIINIMSGGMFPLDIFGDDFVAFARCLPFQYTIYFPIQILTGQVRTNDIFKGLVIQMIWILGCCLSGKLVWKKGLKVYIAAGG